jgi:hypothetical protein
LLCRHSFNQPVGHQGCEDINCPRNLPNSITHLTFGWCFNQKTSNLSITLKNITILRNKIKLFEKIEMSDHTAIIGLPLIDVTTALLKLGFLL